MLSNPSHAGVITRATGTGCDTDGTTCSKYRYSHLNFFRSSSLDRYLLRLLSKRILNGVGPARLCALRVIAASGSAGCGICPICVASSSRLVSEFRTLEPHHRVFVGFLELYLPALAGTTSLILGPPILLHWARRNGVLGRTRPWIASLFALLQRALHIQERGITSRA